jgi:hypothetical protein
VTKTDLGVSVVAHDDGAGVTVTLSEDSRMRIAAHDALRDRAEALENEARALRELWETLSANLANARSHLERRTMTRMSPYLTLARRCPEAFALIEAAATQALKVPRTP